MNALSMASSTRKAIQSRSALDLGSDRKISGAFYNPSSRSSRAAMRTSGASTSNNEVGTIPMTRSLQRDKKRMSVLL